MSAVRWCFGLHCSAAQRSSSAAVRQNGGSGPAQPSCSCHLNCYFHLTRKYRTLLTTHSSTQHGLRSPHCAHSLKHRLQICILLLACSPGRTSME